MSEPNSLADFYKSTKHLSRRRFLQYAGGAAGAAVLLSRPAFSSPEYDLTSSADVEVGKITLDALMLTYFSFPVSIESAAYTFGKNFSATLAFKSQQAPDVKLVPRVSARAEQLTGSYFQHESSQVDNGIVLLSDFGKREGAGFSALPPSPTVFYGLQAPELTLRGNANKLFFDFSFTAGEFYSSTNEMPQLAFDPETIASMAGQIITDPAALVPPRFEVFDPPTLGTGVTLNWKLPSSLVSGEPAEATVTAKIISQTGFTSTALQDAFAVGSNLEIAYSSIQEYPSRDLMDLQIVFPQTASFDAQIYVDKLFKTFVIM